MTDYPHPQDIFERIYEEAHWEAGSGQGSRQGSATKAYRRILQCLVDAPDIQSVVDAGSGDWEFSQLMDWSTVQYRGLDVVASLIEKNRAKFGAANIAFDHCDLTSAIPPRADLMVCKDVLQHWPLAIIQRFLDRVRGRYSYILLTNDIASSRCSPESLNSEITLGAWRPLDLEAQPFGLRSSLRYEYDVEGEWTKRVLLLVSRGHWLHSRLRPNSALNRLRRSIESFG